MNRRNFFNLLGSAILGTAVALRISETLIPRIEIEPTEVISESYLITSYMQYYMQYALLNKQPFYMAGIKLD